MTDQGQFLDTLNDALNTWHLGSSAANETEKQQAHQLLLARRITSPRHSMRNAPGLTTSSLAIESRPREERMHHGSCDALSMLRSSSATSDGLAATLEGCVC